MESELEKLFGPIKKYTTCDELLSGTEYSAELTTSVIKLALKYGFNVRILSPGEDALIRGASMAIVSPKYSSTFRVKATDGKIYVPTYSISAGGEILEEFINGILAYLEEELKRHSEATKSDDLKDLAFTKELFVKQIAGPYKDEKVKSIPLFGWVMVGICISH